MTYGIWLFWFSSKTLGVWVVDANDDPIQFYSEEDAKTAATIMNLSDDAYEIRTF